MTEGKCSVGRKPPKHRRITTLGYVFLYEPLHPLANSQGYVYEHRKVAYDVRAGVISKCERCNLIPITWDTCHVDHDDCDKQNNSSANLVVCCRACNVWRAGHRAKPREVLISYLGETKNAAEWSRDPRVRASYSLILLRKRQGWSDELVLFTEKAKRPNHIPQTYQKKFVDGKRVRA